MRVELKFKIMDNYELVLGKLKKRCEACKLKYSESTYEGRFYQFTIRFERGDRYHRVRLNSLQSLIEFEAVDFENLKMISDFKGMIHCDTKDIEAVIESSEEDLEWSAIGKAVLGTSFLSFLEDETPVYTPWSATGVVDNAKISVTISKPSAIFRLMVEPKALLTISIRGLADMGLREAIKFFQKTTESILFQIELETGDNCYLSGWPRDPLSMKGEGKENLESIVFPGYEYDNHPMALYIYGRTNVSMPLLQFLAFYQVVEFYFAHYRDKESMNRIRNIIKNPRFHVGCDADIIKILATLGPDQSPKAERAMLRQTMEGTVDKVELAAFLTKTPATKEFFRSKNSGFSGKPIKIPPEGQALDELISSVADRMYEIRCKIVHAKADRVESETDLIAPNSEQAKKLMHDISLMQFIARSVLIAGSRPLKLETEHQ